MGGFISYTYFRPESIIGLFPHPKKLYRIICSSLVAASIYPGPITCIHHLERALMILLSNISWNKYWTICTFHIKKNITLCPVEKSQFYATTATKKCISGSKDSTTIMVSHDFSLIFLKLFPYVRASRPAYYQNVYSSERYR